MSELSPDPRFPGARLITPNVEPGDDWKLPQMEDGSRWILTVSAAHHAQIGPRRTVWRATVTDLPSGRTFHLRAAACGLRCYCGAKIVAEV